MISVAWLKKVPEKHSKLSKMSQTHQKNGLWIFKKQALSYKF